MSKARLVITALLRRPPDPGRGSRPLRGAPRLGLQAQWPATRPRARPRSNRGPDARRPSPTATPHGHRRPGPATAQAADRGRPGRRRRHHRLAPSASPQTRCCPGPPSTGSWSVPGTGDPGPVQAAQVVLHPVRGRAAQRDAGSPTSPTTGSPAPTADPAPTPRSSPGSTTTPATPCTSPPTPGSPHRSCWPPSGKPVTCTDTPHPRSPTTAWSTPSGSPATAAKAAAPPSKPSCSRLGHHPEELPTRPPHHLRQDRAIPADDEEVATRPARPARPPSPSSRPSSTPFRERVQPAATAPLPRRTEPPRRPPTQPAPRPPRTAATGRRHPRPSPPRQDQQGRHRHPARRPADYATSASAEPTPEPTSSCSSKTSTSASSTPPPANSSASSPSTHRRDYQPTGRPPGPTRKRTARTYEIVGPAVADVLRHHTCSGGRI